MASKAKDDVVEAEVLTAEEYEKYKERKEERSIKESVDEALEAAKSAAEPLSAIFGQEVGDRIKAGSDNGKKLSDSLEILAKASSEAFDKIRKKTGGALEIPRTIRRF